MALRIKRLDATLRNRLEQAEKSEMGAISLTCADARELLAILDSREQLRSGSSEIRTYAAERFPAAVDEIEERWDDEAAEVFRAGLALRAALDWAEDDWRRGEVRLRIRPDGLILWVREFADAKQAYGPRENGLGVASLFKAAREDTLPR
jgi:hypothetical protein